MKPSPVNTAAAASGHTHLAELERIYTALEQISNRLDAPFSQDSLPLALRHRLKPWARSLNLKMDLPHTWSTDPTVQIQLLLFLIEGLCKLLSAVDPLPQSCHLKLHQQANFKIITFCTHYPHQVPTQIKRETVAPLIPAIQSFRILTHGDYLQTLSPKAHPTAISWTLSWSDSSPSTFT